MVEDSVGQLGVAAVTVGALAGAGFPFVPTYVMGFAGPLAPVAYLLGGAGMAAVCAGYGSLVTAEGRRPKSEVSVLPAAAGPLAAPLLAWPKAAAYAALLGLVAAWLGAAVAGAAGGTAVGWAVALLLATLAVHLLGPRAAAAVQVVLSGALVAFLVAAVLPGVSVVTLGNYDPLLPTEPLQASPVASLARASACAAVGFLGVDAALAVAAVSRDPRRAATRTAPLAVAGLVGLTALAAFVALGVANWARLSFAAAPLAAAAATYLPASTAQLVAAGTLLGAAAALPALVWPAAAALEETAHLAAPLPVPVDLPARDVAAGLVVVGALGLLLGGFLTSVLPLVLVALPVSYGTVAVTSLVGRAADGVVEGRGRWTAVHAASLLTVGSLLLVGLTADPDVALRYTRHAPALAAVPRQPLLQSPLQSTLPVYVGAVVASYAVALVLDAAGSPADRNPDTRESPPPQ